MENRTYDSVRPGDILVTWENGHRQTTKVRTVEPCLDRNKVHINNDFCVDRDMPVTTT